MGGGGEVHTRNESKSGIDQNNMFASKIGVCLLFKLATTSLRISSRYTQTHIHTTATTHITI